MTFSSSPTHVVVRIGLPNLRPDSLRSHVIGDHLITTGHLFDDDDALHGGGWVPFQRAILIPPGE